MVLRRGRPAAPPAIIAFSGDVSRAARARVRPRRPGSWSASCVALRGHGVTDLAAALRAAAAQLAGAAADERVVVLLSDCLRTAGGDPAAALAGIDRLHVLCPLPTGGRPSGPPPPWPAAAAGSASRSGRLADVAPALTRALG